MEACAASGQVFAAPDSLTTICVWQHGQLTL